MPTIGKVLNIQSLGNILRNQIDLRTDLHFIPTYPNMNQARNMYDIYVAYDQSVSIKYNMFLLRTWLSLAHFLLVRHTSRIKVYLFFEGVIIVLLSLQKYIQRLVPVFCFIAIHFHRKIFLHYSTLFFHFCIATLSIPFSGLSLATMFSNLRKKET